MLILAGVTYRVEKRPLLDETSARIPEGAKVGLVGRNGVGKSTLLDLIRGVLEPDDGEIALPSGRRIGFLAQAAPGGTATAHAFVLAADRERTRLLAERDGGPEPVRAAEIEVRLVEIGGASAPARAARILAGLGLDASRQQQPLSDLSGGWRMRVALAAVLFAEPQLLLLDEPTNHLDLESALWLERFLRGYRHTLILVSHDRRVLNAVTTTTLLPRTRQADAIFGRVRRLPAGTAGREAAARRVGPPAERGARAAASLYRPFPRHGDKGAASAKPAQGARPLRAGRAGGGGASAADPFSAAASIEPAAACARTRQGRLCSGPACPVAARSAARPR